MKGSDIEAYTTRFNDLSVLCPHMVTPELKKVERYIWGLPSPIQGNVEAVEPSTFDSAKRLAHRLVTHAIRQGTMATTPVHFGGEDKKRKSWDNRKGRSNQGHGKKQQTVAVHAVVTLAATVPAANKPYTGNLPKCNKCNFHHVGACRELSCTTCNRKGHTARYCRVNTQRPTQITNAGAS